MGNLRGCIQTFKITMFTEKEIFLYVAVVYQSHDGYCLQIAFRSNLFESL